MRPSRKGLVRAGVGAAVGVGALLALTGTGLAQDVEIVGVAEVAEEAMLAEDVQVILDNIWVLIAAVLVIFMQAGFALVESGLTRAKSVANIMAKNLMDFCVGVLAFAAVGFAFAFGGGALDADGEFVADAFIGTGGFFLGSSTSELYLNGWNLTLPTFFIFQVAFAATAATIVSGAMAERTKFKSYFVYSFLLTAFVYPIVVHWTWGGGWLNDVGVGYHDFAGSGIVHMVGGVAALVGTMFLGPRLGKYTKDGKPRAIPGHSIPFAIIGVFILFIGWFGFNGGSELAADGAVPGIALTTLLAGAAGGFVSLLVVWIKEGKPDVAMAGNGVLAGLVGITAGTYVVNNLGAVIIGAIAGVIVVFSVFALDRIRIDDPVGAISVHGVCGAFGVIAVGLFATADGSPAGPESEILGLFYGGGVEQLVPQVVGVLAIAAWTAVAMVIVFAGIKAVMGLRVSEEEEIQGLDIMEHGVPGYAPDVAIGSSGSAAPGGVGAELANA